MNKWKLKFMVFKAKKKMELLYLTYRLKSYAGIKTIGYNQDYSLIIMKLLERYKLPIYSMSVTRTDDDLNKLNLLELHKSGLRIDPKDYISILINTELKQSQIVIGDKLNKYITQNEKHRIQKEIQSKMSSNEIIKAIEYGIREIHKAVN